MYHFCVESPLFQSSPSSCSAKTDIGALYAVHRGMSDVDNAIAVMSEFDGSAASLNAAVSAVDQFYSAAVDAESGEFLMPLVGVLDNPFDPIS